MLRLRDEIFSTGKTYDSAFKKMNYASGAGYTQDGMTFKRPIMVINVASNPAAAETMGIGGKTYTFRSTVSVADEIEIGNLVTNGDFIAGADGSWAGANWVVDATGALHTAGTGYTEPLVQEWFPNTIAGHSYILAYTISGMSAGSVTPEIGSTSGTARVASGSYIETIVATDDDYIKFTPNATFNGKISAISVTDAASDLKTLTVQAIANRINLDTATTLCTAYVGLDKIGASSRILLVSNTAGVTPTFVPDGAKIVEVLAWTTTLTEAQLETISLFKKDATAEGDTKPVVLSERNAGTVNNYLY